MKAFATLLIVGWALAGSNPAYSQETTGVQAFQNHCASCHRINANRVGPALGGVVGRGAGRAPIFRYSPALRDAGFVWTPELLDRWLDDPQDLVPGTRMKVRVESATDRAAIVEYLRSQTQTP